MDFTAEQLSKVTTRLSRDLEKWLSDHSVEPHYSATTLAELLEVSERTVWSYIDLWNTSRGADGIGPVLKLSHKNVRIPASSVNRFLESRRVGIMGEVKV